MMKYIRERLRTRILRRALRWIAQRRKKRKPFKESHIRIIEPIVTLGLTILADSRYSDVNQLDVIPVVSKLAPDAEDL